MCVRGTDVDTIWAYSRAWFLYLYHYIIDTAVVPLPFRTIHSTHTRTSISHGLAISDHIARTSLSLSSHLLEVAAPIWFKKLRKGGSRQVSRSCLVWTADVDTDARGVMRCAFWRRMHRPSSLPRPPATGTRNGTEVGLVSHTGGKEAAQSGTMHGSSRAAAGACAVRERGRMCLYMRAREHCPSHAGRSGPRTRADAVVVASAFARLND